MRSLILRSSSIAIAIATLACSDSTNPPPVPSKLTFINAPVSTTAGQQMAAVLVAIQDAAGNTVTSSTDNVTLSTSTTPGQGFLLGTRTVAAVNGVATFTDLHIDVARNDLRLYATATGLTLATSELFRVASGPAAKLTYFSPPASARTDRNLPVITVGVLDAFENIVINREINVTLALTPSNSTADLSGTTTVTTISGIATFEGLRVTVAGDAFRLTATADGITAAVSPVFSVRAPLAFTVLNAGYFHSCGVTTDGRAYCWGENVSGQLGVSGPAHATEPVAVAGGLLFTTVTTGRDHTCGVSGGLAYCWGSNGNGMLGTGFSSGTPAAVSGGIAFESANAGYEHSCGITPAHVAYCWGYNGTGGLGDGSVTGTSTPVAVSGGLAFASVSAGRFFTCGLTTAKRGYCWGDNSFGELGDSSSASRNLPAPVSGQLEFATISAGGFHACALTSAGVAYCWGDNSNGALGTGSLGGLGYAPLAVAGGLTFATISAGNRHTCAVTNDGVGYCWGGGGMLGDGTTTTRVVPTRVAGDLKFRNISAGRFHSCGITTDGIAYCWGSNGTGQLGNGTTTFSAAPTRVE